MIDRIVYKSGENCFTYPYDRIKDWQFIIHIGDNEFGHGDKFLPAIQEIWDSNFMTGNYPIFEGKELKDMAGFPNKFCLLLHNDYYLYRHDSGWVILRRR